MSAENPIVECAPDAVPSGPSTTRALRPGLRGAEALVPKGLPSARFKSTPEDFVVDELPAYEACGAGEHLYITFRKRNLTTPDALRSIARALGSDPNGTGAAGMKDKVAVTTQTASFPFPMARGDAEAAVADIQLEGIEILKAARHGNKLKPGHLRGNRFTLLLRGLSPDDARGVEARMQEIAKRGVPNAFGPQRFGRDGDNPERALSWLAGEIKGPRDKRDQRLLFSSLQSVMFNEVLAARVEDGTWSTILLGDLAKKREGALFPVAEADLEDCVLRAETGAISATGPLFGASMRWPEGAVRALEEKSLAAWGLDEEKLRQARHLGEGTRRALRLEVEEVVSLQKVDGVELSFVLPKGGYATTLLAQVCTLQEERHSPKVNADEGEERSE